MLEAGWLLLFLFLGICSLIVVLLMWPSLRRATQFKAVDESHAFKRKAPTAPSITKVVNSAQAVKPFIKRLLRYAGWWIARLGEETVDQDTDALFLTFSAEEVSKISVLIIQKVERKDAIRAMPRYTRKQHRVFAAFFDQLKEVLDAELKND